MRDFNASQYHHSIRFYLLWLLQSTVSHNNSSKKTWFQGNPLVKSFHLFIKKRDLRPPLIQKKKKKSESSKTEGGKKTDNHPNIYSLSLPPFNSVKNLGSRIGRSSLHPDHEQVTCLS